MRGGRGGGSLPDAPKMGIIHHDQQEEEEALILSSSDQTQHFHCHQQPKDPNLISKVWVESKKLWLIAGPSIFSRLAMFSMTIITQSFAGHLGDLNLAAISIATTVIISVTFGFLVTTDNPYRNFFFFSSQNISFVN